MHSLDTESVTKAINKRFEKLFKRGNDGIIHARVCAICDKFMHPEESETITVAGIEKFGDCLRKIDNQWNSVSKELRSCYEITTHNKILEKLTTSFWLSPRATCKQHRNGKMQLSSCRSCNKALEKNQMPKYAIANNYVVGSPPRCLLQLTDIELAFITPVKTYGYCFCYTGGFQKQLKGSLSFFKVKIESIVRAAMHFDVLGLANNVVILFYGKMTKEQQQRAREQNKLRTDKILDALKWLLINNSQWIDMNIDLEEIRMTLKQPIICDTSETVDGSTDVVHSNIERTESFQIYFLMEQYPKYLVVKQI